MRSINFLFFSLLVTGAACQQHKKVQTPGDSAVAVQKKSLPNITESNKSIHVFVALCDNKYQGIVPVPAKTGNGQDPVNNLYWGWGYGVRTYFKNSKEWEFIASRKINDSIPERLIFRHRLKKTFLVADAYDGRYIQQCTIDFLDGLSGQMKDTLEVNGQLVGIKGNARMLCYIGHNGLMDFKLPVLEKNTDLQRRDCIILACISKSYFANALHAANANPVLWTSGLMGPEAYTLHDALTGYVNGETNDAIRTRAANTYAAYTKCSFNAARNLLVTGYDK